MNIQLRLANYISRYAPSYKKVSGYLQKKKIENIDVLLQGLGYDESIMCDLWIRSLIAGSKGQHEMYQKLLKKDFPKEMIQEKLAQVEVEVLDWDIHAQQILAQIHNLLGRGKSLRNIQLLLTSRYPYFRDQIGGYIETLDDTASLKKEIQKYKNKYNLTNPSDKQKFYAAIMRKGFSYKQIHSIIDDDSSV